MVMRMRRPIKHTCHSQTIPHAAINSYRQQENHPGLHVITDTTYESTTIERLDGQEELQALQELQL